MSKLNFRTDILPFMIATIGEWAGLFYWLHFLDRGDFILANAVLWAGFLIERLAVVLWLRFVHRPEEGLAGTKTSPLTVILLLIAITLPELVIWAVWLWVAESVGYVVAAAVLAVLMLAEHSGELALVKRLNPLSFLTDRKTLFFTAMEVFGAVFWLYFVRNGQVALGGAVILIGLSVEHIIEGASLKERSEKAASA